MAHGFSLGKVLLFLLATVIGGLLQVWLLYFSLYAIGKDHSLSAILADGGLFFFSTSLAVSSGLALFEQLPGKPSPWHLSFTILVVGVCATAVAIYIAVLIQHLGLPQPFRDHTWTQVGCAVVTFTYAFYVAAETKYFSR